MQRILLLLTWCYMLARHATALVIVVAEGALLWSGYAFAESARIKRPPPTQQAAQDAASEIAKNDGLLRPGDIVVTRSGFLVFKGVAADGYTNEFEPVPNPLNQNRAKRD